MIKSSYWKNKLPVRAEGAFVGRICCFTGHREIYGRYADRLYSLLKNKVSELAENGFSEFRAGGAVGFDTLAALAVLERKSSHGDVSLSLFLPCENQEKYWSQSEKETYRYILAHADSVSYVQKYYSNGVMQERDRRLVDGSDLCVAFLKSKDGGTAYTCGYAKKRGVDVINLFSML